MNKITALYIRTSDASQNTASQKAELKRYVDGHGISNIEWFIDSGKSGESLDRPEFTRMQEKVFNGEISTIIFSRLVLCHTCILERFYVRRLLFSVRIWVDLFVL